MVEKGSEDDEIMNESSETGKDCVKVAGKHINRGSLSSFTYLLFVCLVAVVKHAWFQGLQHEPSPNVKSLEGEAWLLLCQQ